MVDVALEADGFDYVTNSLVYTTSLAFSRHSHDHEREEQDEEPDSVEGGIFNSKYLAPLNFIQSWLLSAPSGFLQELVEVVALDDIPDGFKEDDD